MLFSGSGEAAVVLEFSVPGLQKIDVQGKVPPRKEAGSEAGRRAMVNHCSVKTR
jgi:hypothetical protein